MRYSTLFFAMFFWLQGALVATAQETVEKILPLDGTLAADGRSVTLSWFDATPPRVGSVTIKRRLHGQIGGATWQTIGPALGPVMRYTDNTIRPRVAYEYQVLRSAKEIVDVGYWLTGTQLPARVNRGKVYVVVDDTIADAIAPRLARFERDLVGDGWQVIRHRAERGDDSKPTIHLRRAIALKEWLAARYTEDPFSQHVTVLVGHLPIIRSGEANPDGHERVAQATDLFYADMDGRWTATVDGRILDNRIPGDFIEAQIGRIDFAPVSGGDRETEIRFVRAYFDKNHHWRMGYMGDLREGYGYNGHLLAEIAGLRNIVGPDNVTAGGHHDVGEQKPWLWGVDFGDWNGPVYAEKYANKAAFTINFGSHKQRIYVPFNPMTGLLAQPWYPLSVGWGGRPAWWLHHMALGGTIGDVHFRTVNNGRFEKPYRESMDYFPTGRYLMRNSVWVNLLGDPTLHAFPLTPARDVTAAPMTEGIKLTWTPSPDPDTLTYQIFRAPPDSKEFTALRGAEALVDPVFIDRTPVEGAQYLVRAYGLKTVHAGSFYTLSQGSYATNTAILETDLPPQTALQTTTDQDVRMPDVFNEGREGEIYAFIEGPSQGQLTQDATGWVYTPPVGFSGTQELRYSVSGGAARRTGVLTITVTE